MTSVAFKKIADLFQQASISSGPPGPAGPANEINKMDRPRVKNSTGATGAKIEDVPAWPRLAPDEKSQTGPKKPSISATGPSGPAGPVEKCALSKLNQPVPGSFPDRIRAMGGTSRIGPGHKLASLPPGTDQTFVDELIGAGWTARIETICRLCKKHIHSDAMQRHLRPPPFTLDTPTKQVWVHPDCYYRHCATLAVGEDTAGAFYGDDANS